MKRSLILLVLAFAAAAPALAEKEYAGGQLQILFHDTPCLIQSAELALVQRGVFSIPKAATALIAGRPLIPACWALDKDGDYVVLDAVASGATFYAKNIRERKGST